MRIAERATLVTVACTVVGALLLVHCESKPTPLPAKVQATVDRHVATSVADTATTHRLERDTAAEVQHRRELTAAQRRVDSVVRISAARADSLAAAAMIATTARDSAEAWRRAYVERTHEADSLTWDVHIAEEQKASLARQLALSDSIAHIWKAHALRADTVIVQLLPLAQHRDACKIAWVLNCPTRTQAVVGGTILGVAATAVATGKLKLPISVHW